MKGERGSGWRGETRCGETKSPSDLVTPWVNMGHAQVPVVDQQEPEGTDGWGEQRPVCSRTPTKQSVPNDETLSAADSPSQGRAVPQTKRAASSLQELTLERGGAGLRRWQVLRGG